MHVVTTRRQYTDRSGVTKTYRAHLLRRSFREGGKVKNETLGNLSALPDAAVDAVKAVLRGQVLTPAGGPGEAVEIVASRPHGHVAAVVTAARRLGFPELLGPPCRLRDLAFALLVARVVRPGSKLATSRWWADTTLAADLGITEASTDEVYAALDWLLGRQEAIEAALAARHLTPAGMALFDLSSSSVTGARCPLVNYGLLTDPDGRPVAVRVFAGNTADPAAFTAAVDVVRAKFGLTDLVLVADRGMITSARIAALRDLGGFGWVTALRAPDVAALAAADGPLQLSLFDQHNLAEISHPDYPGERLVACRNPALADERARKRATLLAATDTDLDKIVAAVAAGRLVDPDKIGIRVGKVIDRRKMGKHYLLDIGAGRFGYAHDQAGIAVEAALGGIYVLRTSVPAAALPAADVVRAYKNLAHLERDFGSLKTIDVDLRPIRHYTADRVRAHVWLCALAAYLVWHLRRDLAPLTVTDETPPHRCRPGHP